MKPVILPIRTQRGLNDREHWAKRAKRVKNERTTAKMLMPKVATPCTIKLTRLSPGTLDSDNLQGALKAVRDGIADRLEIDDGSEAVRWVYAQEKSKIHAVRIEIEEAIKEITK